MICLQQLQDCCYRGFETCYPISNVCQPLRIVRAVRALLALRLLAVLARSLLPGRVDPGWHFQVFRVVDDGLVVGLLVGVGVLAPVAADLVFAALDLVVARFVAVTPYTAVPDLLKESVGRGCGWAWQW